jgi:hypothetical protein
MCFRIHERDGSPASRVPRSATVVVCFRTRGRVARVAGVERAVGTPDDIDEMGWWMGVVERARPEPAPIRTRFRRRQTGNYNPLSKRRRRDMVAGRRETPSGRRARNTPLQGVRLPPHGWGGTREAPLCFESEENLQPGAKLRSTRCSRRYLDATPVLRRGGSAQALEAGISRHAWSVGRARHVPIRCARSAH